MTGCQFNAATHAAEVSQEKPPGDTLPDESEQMEVKDSVLQLAAVKRKTAVENRGEVCLTYKLMHQSESRTFCFNYFPYSDIIFPDTSIAMIGGVGVKQSNYYLYKDRFLLLPLIGMNFLQVYVIDLQEQQVLEELRTSQELVWINENTRTFLLTDSPDLTADPICLYKAKAYQVNGQTVDFKREAAIKMNIEDRYNRDLLYPQVKRILK